MRKSILLLVVLFFVNFQFVFSQNTLTEPFKIQIISISNIRGYGTGDRAVVPKKGYKCMLVTLTLTNMSNENAHVDFNKFILLDTITKITYKPQAVVANTFFTLGVRTDKKVKPGDKIVRNVYYFVKKETIVKYFSYKENIYVKE
ncbi:MAG: hypothetical protein QM727_13055 [Niabella sp.]